MEIIIKIIVYLIPAIAIGFFLGKYIYKIWKGEEVFLSKILSPIENACYRFMHIKQTEEMHAKKYFFTILIFSVICFLVLFFILVLQGMLPLNPERVKGFNLSLAFNVAWSFVTNTNWQSYVGENSLSYFSQMLGLTVQNFVSAGVGISVLFALVRGITKKQKETIGNFWKDLTKVIVYILLPLSILYAIFLSACGVMQNIKPYEKISTLETAEEQIIPMGPVASQVAIKQLGTNGGGFFGTNAANPLENPNAVTNYLECIAILLLPISLVFFFGFAVEEKKQGYSLLAAMLIVLVLCLLGVSCLELQANNWEGKEARNGVIDSSIWSVFTTAAANGSVNAMHDSFTPLAGGIQMLLMGTGEVILGGVGSGLYTMLGFVIVTVFIAGLMIGRTPEYSGKKIEPYEMKMAIVLILTTPFCILITNMILIHLPNILQFVTNGGAHAFSEILYAAISTGANNGSSFAGLNSNSFFINSILAINMIIARFLPMFATLKIAEALAYKKKNPVTTGTLQTTNGVFVILLIVVIVLIGALSFLPSIALGPIAEAVS